MNIKNIKPTNLKLLKMTEAVKNRYGQVKTGQIHGEGANFNPEGLFSVEIFGRVGSSERNIQPGWIALNTEVLHPTVFKTVTDLGAIYLRIMEGKEHAIFDAESKDFVASASEHAETGYAFFMKHFKEIVFKENTSEKRTFNIKLVEKSIAEKTCFIDGLILTPAGLRDYIIGRNGRPEEDEINTLYRKVMSRASIIDPRRAERTPDLYDEARVNVQKVVFEVYKYILSLLNGKGKLLQGKWESRKIFNTTANVLSSYVDRTTGKDDPRRLFFNETRMGLYQFARTIAPKTQYEIRNKYIRDIFPEGTQVAYLTNAKTLKQEEVSVRGIQKEVDLWVTDEGLERVIASLGNPDIRQDPITFKDKSGKNEYYMGLLYKDNKHFKFFQDIDQLPEGYSRDNVTPVNLFDFIYMSIFHLDIKYIVYITRYPVTGYGSIYPSFAKLGTTVDTDILHELDYLWEPMGIEGRAISFPKHNSGYINTVTVAQNRLNGLGGDYDGDVVHSKATLADESVKEATDLMKRREFYISDSGEFFFSNGTETLNTVLSTLTNRR